MERPRAKKFKSRDLKVQGSPFSPVGTGFSGNGPVRTSDIQNCRNKCELLLVDELMESDRCWGFDLFSRWIYWQIPNMMTLLRGGERCVPVGGHRLLGHVPGGYVFSNFCVSWLPRGELWCSTTCFLPGDWGSPLPRNDRDASIYTTTIGLLT